MMSRGAERQLNMELVNLWHKARKQEFCMYFGTDRNRTAGTAYRQTECTGCPHRVLPKDFPALILPQRAGNLHIKALSLSKNQILRKKEVIKMTFFTTAVTGLKTVVTAIGAGVAVWGVINLLEGYGNDNPGANAHVR